MEVVIKQNEQELVRLEGVIQKNIGAFYEVGRALMEIRDKNYYSAVLGYDTFEAYCKERWDFTRDYAYKLISSSSVVDNVDNCIQKPATESQTRPLAKLEPAQQREAWQKAVETAPEGKVTAAHVYKIVKETMLEQEKPIEHTECAVTKEDSRNLSSIKTTWNMCTKAERVKFVKWLHEYYTTYLS